MRKLNQKQYAAFAANAKTLDSLRRNEVNYVPGVFEVTKVIVLGKEDFEKLSEDVSPEYPFLKDNRELMSADPGGLFRCLMVRTKGEQEYMLIAQGRNSLYLGYGKDCRKVNLQDVPMEHLVLEEPKAYQEHAVFYAIPNALNCGSCSLVICDPKSEILRKTGGALKANGYEVRVFDLLNPDASFCYNPLAYVRDDKDVLRLIETLIQSTTPPGAQSTDPFWTKSETALLQALVLYLMHEAPPEEQNFAMVMEMLAAAEVREEDEEYESPLDILFARLEMRDPESIAVKQYHVFKMGAGKTLKSILISVGVRLSAFNLPQIARLTYTDDLHLEEMGEKKIALFCCIPDSDKSLNYLVGMIYGQLIQTLYFVADRKYKGRLPVPVHLLIDEAPNIALPTDNFLPWLSTMRSRNIFCSYIAQNMAQIKALFKEQWESLVGLCDEFLYLGGNEKETHKYVSELMGKETLDTNTYGHSRGRSGSFSVNDQQTGRELLTPDEVRMLDNRKAILFVRGERPMLDDKYDLMHHPNIRLTEDGGAAPYDYTHAKDAADDLDYSPDQYEDFELLEPEDFLKP